MSGLKDKISYLKKVLVQKSKRFESILANWTILVLLLKKVCDQYGKENIFKWKHYRPDIILLTVRWYLRYNLSLRDLVEMMEERGFSLAHTTIMRWVHQYGLELNERIRTHLKLTNNS